MLLLGGFAIAAALSKHFIAKQLAVAILSRVGRRPRDVLLANMLVATFLSMWISNVAAPVLCFSLVQVRGATSARVRRADCRRRRRAANPSPSRCFGLGSCLRPVIPAPSPTPLFLSLARTHPPFPQPQPILRTLPPSHPFAKALVIGIALASNLGAPPRSALYDVMY